MSFLVDIEAWLDRKISEVDRKHFYLKNSERSYERLLWRLLYKPPPTWRDYLTFSDKNSIELFKNEDVDISKSIKPANQVVHVVNYLNPDKIKNPSLKKRTKICLDSFDEADKAGVQLLACHEAKTKVRDGWKSFRLRRSAKSALNGKRDLAFLIDMLDAACEYCDQNDYIFYTNLDCPVSYNIYEKLLNQNEDIIQYFIRDVDADNLNDLFRKPYKIKQTGVDGFAIKKGVYLSLRKYLPDFVVGEPHWDTTYSGIFNKFHHTKDNTVDLYHIHHERFWDTKELSNAGKHNELLYRDAYEYGLIDEPLIKLKKPSVLLMLNYSGEKYKRYKVERISRRHQDYELAFLDLIKNKQAPTKNIPEEVFYFPIIGEPKTYGLNQKMPMMNIGANLFLDRSTLNFVDLRDHKSSKIFKTISCDAYKRRGFFDNFVENQRLGDTIFLNDEGLLSKI